MSDIPRWRGDVVYSGDESGRRVAKVRVVEGTNTFVKDRSDDQAAPEPLFEVGDRFLFRKDDFSRQIIAVERSPIGNLVYVYE